MSDERKAELLKLANAATPGPWHHGFHDGDGRGTKSEGSWIVTIPSGAGVTVVAASDHDGFKTGVKEPRDADYIAAAHPETIKALLDENAALARERDELRAVGEWLVKEIESYESFAGVPTGAWHVLAKRAGKQFQTALAKPPTS